MKEEYIAIRLSLSKKEYQPSKRCLLWCDDCWYESTLEPVFKFPLSELETLKKQLANHYIYKAAFLHTDGTEEVWDYFYKEPVVKQKSNGFTIKIKI